jgi:AcrR family transcriptional regulator
VGVAQPYVFSLFPSKRDLFLAALDRSFELVADTFRSGAADFHAGRAPVGCRDIVEAMGRAYRELLLKDRDYLMLQHHCYAACDDELIRARVRRRHAQLVDLARELSGAPPERLDEFFRRGMALQVAATLGVEELSVSCEWVREELRRSE